MKNIITIYILILFCLNSNGFTKNQSNNLIVKKFLNLEHCTVYIDNKASQKKAKEIGDYYERAYKIVEGELGAAASKKMSIYVYS